MYMCAPLQRIKRFGSAFNFFFIFMGSVRSGLIWWNQTFDENKGMSSEIRHQLCRAIDPLNLDDIVSEDKMFDEF